MGVVNRTAITLLALAALPAGASAATQWLPPSPLAGQVRGTGAPAVAGNDDGRAVAAWATPTGVVTTLRTPGGPWYQPVRVPGSGRGATQVAVAMTTGGQAAVTWIEGGRVRVSLRPARRRFLPATALSLPGRIATTPVVALGGACAPLVAWSGEAVTGGANTIESACASSSGRFAATRSVSQPDELAFTPAVATSAGGSVIAWRRD